MADVQLENGHVRIANALWEAWNRADLDRNELRVLLALVRLSYGWGRSDTAGTAGYKRIERATGLGSRAVAAGVKGLVQKQVVQRVRPGVKASGTPAVYAIVKDFDRWSPGVLPEWWKPAAPTSAGGSTPTSLVEVGGTPLVEVPPTSVGGSHIETEENKEQKNNPPTPPAGGLKKKSKRRTHDGGPEALDALEHWKALQAERGTRRTIKAWPAGWGVQARIEEFGLDTVKAVITWAHKSDHKLAVNLRDGDHLTDTLFRPSKFPKYEGPALAFADNGGHTDSPSDYELPTKEDYVEFRGGNVRRSPDGTWHPSWQKLLKPAYPWREVMLRIADMTFRSREYDKHEPTPYREALMACRFPADPRPNDLQHAIDGALDEVRDDA